MCKPKCNHQKLDETNSYLLATFFDMIDRLIEDGLDEGQTDLLTMFIMSKVPIAANNAKDMRKLYSQMNFDTEFDKHMQAKTLKVIDDAFNALQNQSHSQDVYDDTNPKF